MLQQEPSYKEVYEPISFPRDEQKHDHTIEWWYFNGHVRTTEGRSFSYMNCLFAAKPKKVNLPIISKIPLNTLYFSHYLLTDHKKHYCRHRVNPLCVVDPNSFTKPLLWAHYDNSCLLEETDLFNYHIVNNFIDLRLCSAKQPLLVGGKGFVDLAVKTTYYYSLTRLVTKGVIKTGGAWQEAEGLSWMDHQWAQTPATPDDKWTWFCLQLDNGLDLICFVYGDEVKTYHASLIDGNSVIRTTDRVILNAGSVNYVSPVTGATYCLAYEIHLPDWQMDLEVKPLNKAQEMVFLTTHYWEGGISVCGKHNGQDVRGQGFMELIGSPAKKGLMNVYLQKIQQGGLKNNIRHLSAGIRDKFRAYR